MSATKKYRLTIFFVPKRANRIAIIQFSSKEIKTELNFKDSLSSNKTEIIARVGELSFIGGRKNTTGYENLTS